MIKRKKINCSINEIKKDQEICLKSINIFLNFLNTEPKIYVNKYKEDEDKRIIEQKKVFDLIKKKFKNNNSFGIVVGSIKNFELLNFNIFEKYVILHIFELLEYDITKIEGINHEDWIYIWGNLLLQIKQYIELC